MSAVRIGLVSVVLLGATVLGLHPAAAGGSSWNITPDPAAPGELVHAEAVAAWAHNDHLGTPDDGPWRAWIRPVGNGIDLHGGTAGVPEDAVPVGDITISDEGGFGTATVDFTLPQLPPGDYELIHCNDPCTTTLGDITWGIFTVTAPTSAQTPPTTQPAPTDDLAAASTSAPASPLAGAPHTDAHGPATTAGFRRNTVVGGVIVALLLATFHLLLPRGAPHSRDG